MKARPTSLLGQPPGNPSSRAETLARRGPAAALAEPAAARILGMYLRTLARWGPCECVDAGAQRLSAADLRQTLGEVRESGRPLVIAYWVADALAIALASLARSEFRDLLQPARFLLDDTFAGRVIGRVIGRFHGHHTTLKLAGIRAVSANCAK